MLPTNPYKTGTAAAQDFNTFLSWYSDKPADVLCNKLSTLRTESQDYCRYGWQVMYRMSFEAKCIESILAARIAV